MKEDKKERDPIWELILGYIGILFGFLILSMGFNMLITIWKALFN
jgi:hypothetical protein